ncbi:MAG: type II toxin-antitoxin system HicA family toxin [Beijerinckiaceae bacterium]
MGSELYRELCRLLKQAGCHFVRQGKGSHEIWYSPIAGRNFTVPRNIVKAPTANAVLKQAGLPKHF